MDWRDVLRARLFVCASLFAVWTVSIEARLVYLQVVEHADMMARANRQQLRTIKLPAKRGEIVDRSGRVLAYSVDADTIGADPTEVLEPDVVAAHVCAALDHCSAQQREVMADRLASKQQFVYLARQVSAEEARRVKALALPGVAFYKESRRYYPNKELAAHVLGYVGVDNVGLAGLESTFDARIRGREGKMLLQTDARRRAMSSREERHPTAGDGLELTIDQYLQFIADRELRTGVAENNASGGSAIILQPYTGEILALANWPTFNPNAFNAADVVARRNRAVQDLYEPGSTFKVVTASAAVEEGLIRTSDPIDCSPGYITFGTRVIRDTHEYGTLPFIDVIAKSSNVGAIKVGMKVGPTRLSQYISRFGFGQTLASDFRGANAGMVYSAERLDISALALRSPPSPTAESWSSRMSSGRSSATATAKRFRAMWCAARSRRKPRRRSPKSWKRSSSAAPASRSRRSMDTRSPARRAPPPRSSTGITPSSTTTRRLSGLCLLESQRSSLSW
ncbi:MAG: penicillin-binding protein 2 [Acidobacteria bacterium]|nr:penicillin-binding protein 2 [Acidobacteriota bacterium]